ncbi:MULTISPECIES: preprotein translocase subunit YajC [unclassified Brevundimonas]|jgi:preprotein translocase subunit YajC|uniref:preprotein translocase subunit YajC n=1 Tax=unclassified Brevundimonas TaxID=2622653 RepID=UPI0025C30661|nr:MULTISPECIES: preprotein translocase subunit YajC [unclassified Brevundimonas]
MNATQDAGMMAMIVNIAPILLIFVLFYFLMIRPQQKRMKQHQEMIKALKRGDEVVLSNGMVGKVTRVEETEAMVDIAQGVSVRVVRTMIAEVRNRTAIAANDKG